MSVTLWYCIKTTEHIAANFSPSDSPINLVYSSLITVTKFGQDHPQLQPQIQPILCWWGRKTLLTHSL